MNKAFEKDAYRYYGGKKEDLAHKIFRRGELKFMKAFRRAQNSKNPLNLLLLERMSRKTGIQIPARTKIGEGFFIGHTGRLIINPDVTIGKNVNVATGVTIGQENRGKRKGVPTIGDCVWIGTNSVIVGNIKIGNDVMIAPLTFVNFDVPDHSIVVGNPAKIIHRDNATEGYVEYTV